MNNHPLAAAIAHSRADAHHADVQRLKQEGKVVLEVDEEMLGTDQAPAYWQQGDESLHTHDVLKQRQALRFNSRVRAELRRFWLACKLTMLVGKQTLEPSEDPGLHYEPYAMMMRNVYKCVLDHWDAKDAEECVLECWETDRRGTDSISRHALMDSVFEVRTRISDPRCRTASDAPCLALPCLALPSLAFACLRQPF